MNEIILPDVGIKRGIKSGRIPREGYQRSAIINGPLSGKLDADPDFQKCMVLAKGRTLVTPQRIKNLYLLIRSFMPHLPKGDIFEFGSYKGGSALFMAQAAKTHLPGTTVYALDTFEGMPPTDNTIDVHSAGNFKDTSYDEIMTAKAAHGLDNLVIVKGLFEDTAPGLLDGSRKVALCHIDCDIKSAVAFSYEICKPHMVTGGYYALDDTLSPNCLGATEAMEELLIQRDGKLSEQIFPHHVFREGL